MKDLFRIFVLSITVVIVLSSCASTNVLTMGVIEPAPVYLPKHIQKIGIVNRSIPSEGNKELDEIDKILSAEGKLLDKEGARKAILGLHTKLSKNNTFNQVKIIENTALRSPGMGVLPAALSWETVQKICSENNIDALYVLSFYDTDAKVKYKTTSGNIETPIGQAPIIYHHVTINTLIKTGWRLYNSTDKRIHDEYIINKNITSTGKGINPIKAISTIIDRKEAVLDVSTNIGKNYGKRVLPYRIRVSRNYYVSGTENFKVAQRKAQAGDWSGAADLWNKETTNSDSKIAGRAYYNMAIINEINGDLETAVDWASKSYVDYENKEAIKYIKILKHRIRKNSLLKQQAK